MADILSFIWPVCMQEDLKLLFHIAECSTLPAGMVQRRSYGSPIRILKVLTGIDQRVINTLLTLWLITGIHQYL